MLPWHTDPERAMPYRSPSNRTEQYPSTTYPGEPKRPNGTIANPILDDWTAPQITTPNHRSPNLTPLHSNQSPPHLTAREPCQP
jgi:hypothetical protein